MCVQSILVIDMSDNEPSSNASVDDPVVGDTGRNLLNHSISQEPVNILFASRSSVEKRDVWQIDLMQILDMLAKILEQSGKKDLRVAGMAALSSSLIYKMKVESISALRKSAMERKPMPVKRNYPDIEIIGIPYRHESTYPVSLDDLLGLLQNLINTMANPSSKRRRREPLPITAPPDIKEHLLSLETVIESYQDMIMNKIEETGRGVLQDIIENLSLLDSIRCFFAALFLARDGKVDLKQVGDEIHIVALFTVAGIDNNNTAAAANADSGSVVDDTIKNDNVSDSKNHLKDENGVGVAGHSDDTVYDGGNEKGKGEEKNETHQTDS